MRLDTTADSFVACWHNGVRWLYESWQEKRWCSVSPLFSACLNILALRPPSTYGQVDVSKLSSWWFDTTVSVSCQCLTPYLPMKITKAARSRQQENNGAGKLSSTLVQTHQHMPNVDEEDNRYQINLEAVLYRLRYPRYLLHIRASGVSSSISLRTHSFFSQECYGKTQELFFEVLFQHGMLHTRELFARISVNQYRLDISVW